MSIKLKDLCELIVDCPHSTEPDEGQGYPIIRTPNIGPGYLNLDGVQRVGKEAYKRRNVRAVPQAGDLILAREAPAGNVGIIPDGEKVCLGQRTVLIRPDRSKADPAYLNYYLNAPKQRHKLLSNSNGATVSHVNMPIIHNLPVDLPPLPVQSRNAGVLSAYDKLIENNRRQIKLLEEAAQRLYKEWFVDLRFPGHETTPIVDGLPEKWERGKLGSVVEFRRGKTITRKETVEGGVPVVAGGLEPAYYHNAANTGSPVITVSGSGANAGFCRLYVTKVWASDCSFADANMTEDLIFVYLTIKVLSNGFKQCQRGSAQPHVYPKHVNDLQVLIPNVETLECFRQLVAPFFIQIGILEQQIVAAREARDRLLPKLMSGEIEV
ncbi:restriction endonuclease subunit S [Ellagibacter isourolithinifaciens]|uniref:restriction endonuclease subunit S n=1 Tax=Ellagibacter isourolithinifaciens TaxID=2137581 RepID=UPI003A929A1A